MKLLFSLLLTSIISHQNIAVDIVIKNGKILDGTGNSWYYADLAIKDGKVIKIGKLKNYSALREIDAAGMYVTPGFIDVHTHIEGDEVNNPFAENFLYNGVTSVVTGNCGSSMVDLHKYFNMLDSLKPSVNVASLIGHNDVRKAVLGSANREPTFDEINRMKNLVEIAMSAGAVGFSTGLIYIPGTYAKTGEVLTLAKVSSTYNGLYATHIRDEADSITDAINEALHIAREAKMAVQISHFKVSGQQNWGRSGETLALIKAAREQGLDVTIDQYPYTASSTSLSTLLPDWVMADSRDSIHARLQRGEIRSLVKEFMMYKLQRRGLANFGFAVVAAYTGDSTYNGKSIEQINLMKGNPHAASAEAETIIEIIENGGAAMVFHGMSEDDVKNIMKYPFNMFASDATIRIFNSGAPHPRGYGTNARVIARYVRSEKVLSLEDAIRRMTSLPAQKFNLQNRGLLKEGFAADILVFNDEEVQDLSTYENPHQYSKGFRYVLVNGKITVENGIHNRTRNGIALRAAH